jgi:hypothetical protein
LQAKIGQKDNQFQIQTPGGRLSGENPRFVGTIVPVLWGLRLI